MPALFFYHENFSDHCLVMWTDENSVSVVPLTTPPSTEITAGCSCTVKGFEGYSSWVVSVGLKEEMVGLEKEFITSASPNKIKSKPKEEDAVEPIATMTTKPKKTTKRGRKGASLTSGSPPAKKSKVLKVLGKSELCMYLLSAYKKKDKSSEHSCKSLFYYVERSQKKKLSQPG